MKHLPKKSIVNEVWQNMIILPILLAIFALSLGNLLSGRSLVAKNQVIYAQPELAKEKNKWPLRSVDTQVISKHWPDVTRDAVIEQVALIKQLGANYVAIGTPYDRVEDMRMWAEEIHAAGMNVWFRSHWAEWEGDEGLPATMSPEEYLDRTRAFIVNNPDLFHEGDAFTVAVEAEQVGIGLGKRFLTWNEYRDFLWAEITVASEAFISIGLEGKVHTNWLSMNGWIVDNVMTQEFAQRIGLIVVDHFPGQTQTIGEKDNIPFIVDQMLVDLDRYHEKLGVPIILGEWGYQIFQNVDDASQAEFVELLLSRVSTRSYLIGLNYWVHMGNPAALIRDEMGSNLTLRPAALTLKSFYDSTLQLK